MELGRDTVRGQRGLLRPRPLPLPAGAGGRPSGRAAARRYGTPARRRLRPGAADPAAGAAFRARRRSRRRRRHGRRGAARSRAAGSGERGVRATPSGGAPRGPGNIPRRDLRPVVPLDGPPQGRVDRPRDAGTRRRVGTRKRDDAPGRRRDRWPAGTATAAQRGRGADPGVPRPRATGGQRESARRHARRRGEGHGRGGLRRPATDRGRHWSRAREIGDEVVASVYSRSGSAPHLFGDRLAEFETELRGLLRRAAPNDRFYERQREIELVIWRR